MTGLATTFGSGAMTNSINEIEDSEVILAIGSNTTEAHPQIARRMLDAVDSGAKLIVIDPRRTRLAECAHIHLDIKPGTDIPLLNAMMRVILDQNLIDDLFIEMRTENYHQLRDMLYRLDLDETARITGVGLDKIKEAAQVYAQAQKAVICYCLGITQHICGTRNVQSIANLAMMTGNVEKENTGVDPLRGQNNVQGACDMGALPSVFPSYQSVTNEDFREKFAAAWQVELPDKTGLTLMEMTHCGSKGPIRAMYIMGENPMLSDPVLSKVKNTLANLDFLVVTDIFMTETAKLAHVVLPAASFAEKTGTFTNSERRVQMVRQAIAPIGNCRTDADIIMQISAKMGYPMNYDNPAEIMEEIAMLAPIYGGMHHDRLEAGWGLQWPCWDRDHPGTPYLHKYFFTRGRGHFVPADHAPPSELPDKDYPFLLITGRVYQHYHTGTMTRKCTLHNRECGQALLQINAEDADKLRVRNGTMLAITSRRGVIKIAAQVSDEVKPGMIYTNFHFKEAPINALCIDTWDPLANCPEYKVCAVKIEVAHD